MKKQILEERLQPEDWALCRMVQSVLKTPCEPKAGDDHYFFEADYGNNPPEIILAVYDAICGRAGERLGSITDDPDARRLVVRIKYAGGLVDRSYVKDAKDSAADVFKHGEETCLALLYTGENAERVAEFVGGGIRQTICGKTLFSFVNAQSVVCTAHPGEYIRKVKPYLYEVIKAAEFERVWRKS